MSHGVLGAIAAALRMAFMMGWEILWALVLGFALSGVVPAVHQGRDEPASAGQPPAPDPSRKRRGWPIMRSGDRGCRLGSARSG